MLSVLINATTRSLSRWIPGSLWRPTLARVDTCRWEVAAVFLIVVLAALLRFWGLGGWGLEYDEETMAMAATHVLEQGYPALPSGMTYVRGFVQIYAMAGAVMLFGESEWSLRLPSVLCGLLLIVFAYQQGRRFLLPMWNVVFVATVAFLPAMILDSQEARMYIFMMTATTAFTVLVFRWERTGRLLDLVAAMSVMALAIQFQALAIFSAFVLFFPGLAHGDWKKLLQGTAAFVCAAVMFVGIMEWTNSFYPPSPDGSEASAETAEPAFAAAHLGLIAIFVPLCGLLVTMIRRSIQDRAGGWLAAGLLLIGFALQLAFFYHIAFVLFLAGSIVAIRYGVSRKALAGIVVLMLALALAHVWFLHTSGFEEPRKLIRELVGRPSVWAYIQFATYSYVGIALLVAGTSVALWNIAHRQRVADVWLYALLAVWLPLFLLGFFAWYMPPRYTQFALVPMLMCACAAIPLALGETVRAARSASTEQMHRTWPIVGAIALVLMIVNPVAVARVVNAGYSIHPDHRGAAEFVRAQDLQPTDILIAEDVLQQTYYLGRVDYWLIGKDTAEYFTRDFNGRALDIYTHTPVLDTGEALRALLTKADRGSVYIIGSGEQHEDGRAHARSHGIQEALQSSELKVVYSGRDGLTKVWMSPPRKRTES